MNRGGGGEVGGREGEGTGKGDQGFWLLGHESIYSIVIFDQQNPIHSSQCRYLMERSRVVATWH